MARRSVLVVAGLLIASVEGKRSLLNSHDGSSAAHAPVRFVAAQEAHLLTGSIHQHGRIEPYLPQAAMPDRLPERHLPPGANSIKDVIMDIGGGTGASVSGTGDTFMDQALLRRMRYQDKAVMLILLFAYMGSLLFSASFAYRQAKNESSVTYYADPRFHNITTDCEDIESFLTSFNGPPSDAQLQVTGLMPLPPLPDYVVDAAVTWLGARYRVAFSFALDLSPWLVPLNAGAPDGSGDSWSAGVVEADVELLAAFLACDSNDLSYVELKKQVEWKDWEELATNIKSKIRQAGFNGHIDVRRNCEEVVSVHKNRQWANFMHSRTTKVLMALSVVGWFVYQPYMWLRHHYITIPCKYRVDVGIGQYWPLIQDKIGADGFNHAAQPLPTRAERNRTSLGRGPS